MRLRQRIISDLLSPAAGIAILAASALAVAPSLATGTTGTTTTANTGMSPALKALVDFQCDKAIALTVPHLVRAAALPISERSNKVRLARYYVLIGRAFMFDDNEPAAEQALSIAQKLDPDNLLAAAYRAESLARMGRLTEADVIFKSLQPLAAREPAAAKAIAKRWQSLDFNEGNRLLLAAIALDPSDNSSRVALAEFLRNHGLNERAAAVYRLAAANDLSPYNREVLAGMADAITAKHETALMHFKQAGAILPDDPGWHTKRGFVLTDHGGKDAALKEFSKAAQCRRFSTHSLTVLAEYLNFIDRKQEALKCLDYVERFRPWSAILHIARGDVYMRAKEMPAAEAEYKKALAINPRIIWIYDHLANVYTSQKRYDLVVKTMEEAVRAVPSSEHNWKRLADGQLALDQFENAIGNYRKALSLATGPASDLDAGARAQLAVTHACLGTAYYKANRPDEAVAEAVQFNHLKPLAPPIKYFTWVRRRPDRLNFKQPAASTPVGKAVRFAAVADMLYETGNLTQCCDEYRKAIELDPNNIEWNMCLLGALIDKGDYAAAAREDLVLANKLMGKAPQMLSKKK